MHQDMITRLRLRGRALGWLIDGSWHACIDIHEAEDEAEDENERQNRKAK